ncbi:hypothetical protein NVP1077O_47 [Vibrio phage 1.077.O._10N.261.45.A10]|nr:hypothetical protein NVP1070O_47 [Vibrio phage 1.070.O._10N.261.45.B2]AUR85625.1 hypothetical protein NVP1077O_47 [Vibrio phage 1.077.O._10N.261.45.A10]
MKLLSSIKESVEGLIARYDTYKHSKAMLVQVAGDPKIKVRVATDTGRAIYIDGALKDNVLSLLEQAVREEGEALEVVAHQLQVVDQITTTLGDTE